jgi:hypothetical protein
VPDGWQEEYKERVLAEFKRVHEDIAKLGVKIDSLKDTDITNMKLAIATMQQENKDSARTSGFLSGMSASIIVSVIAGLILYSLLHVVK